jgi:hypothetical protein
MRCYTQEMKLHVTNTPHDGGVAVPPGESKFPLLVRRRALAYKLAGSINASFLTFDEIVYSFPRYVGYRNRSMSFGTVPKPLRAHVDCPLQILVRENPWFGCLN